MKKIKKKVVSVTPRFINKVALIEYLEANKTVELERLLDQYSEGGNHLPIKNRLIGFLLTALTTNGIPLSDAQKILNHVDFVKVGK